MEQDSLKTMRILFRAHQAVETYAKKDILSYGLTLNEFTALEVLYHKGKLPVQSVCDAVLIPNSSMTYVLDKLEVKKLITRTQDKLDKRTYYVELSENGLNFSNEIFPKHYEHMRKVFDILSTNEQESLNQLLKKIGYFAKGD
ncbi:MarR family winged helix-turn-helix transcriptional regulator [Acholeplasma hippikon]|uniref:MarR family transcriptional regulator n=1 Tax=Acholeplasma hippikon TaxID=264636 RepID=A0A449BJ10_9MOLU|nr:MarR family winged helix-turn-helix transcriptional regulator [Acholeplasma hippikon]VEU82307.1 MarR family transcriptional regulator [Acholeplasma hippikon]